MLDMRSPCCSVRQNRMPLDGAFGFLSGALAYAVARTVCSARRRYDIIFILGLFFRIKSVFPHLFLFSLLQMHYGWYFVANAHVGAPVVVEVDVAFYHAVSMLKRVEAFLAVYTFHLYFPVDAFCDGIVSGIVVLAHGDGNLMFLEHGYVGIAAILHAAVGVVDELLEDFTAGHSHDLSDSHPQCLHGDGSLERPSQCPTNNLVGIGIGNQVQVAHVAASQSDIGDVGYPKSVCSSRNKAFYQVLVLVVAVVGVRRVAGLRLGKHQPLAAHQHEKAVPTRHEVTPEHRYEHQPKLVAAYARILLADFPDGFDELALLQHLLLNVGLRLVKGLTAMAK